MALDPTTVNAKIDELVSNLRSKEGDFIQASADNDAAQAAAQAAVATAAGTLQVKNTTHDAFSASIDALVEFATSLKQQ